MFRKTILHDTHVNLNAKMGLFAGYDMPLYYDEGVIKEHLWVRESAGLFDVSHMGQIIIEGAGSAEFLERITPSEFQSKSNGRAQYTVLTNEQGGIIDDLIITRIENSKVFTDSDDKFFIVLNAGCKEKDIEWIKSHMPETLCMTCLEDHGLIALQGSLAVKALEETIQCDVSELSYMHMMVGKSPCGEEIFISRLGYTGEDGFELSLPNKIVSSVWEGFLRCEGVKPIGLAARDSLRLEMGYPLYGHDIDDTTSPVEADLQWIISKKTKMYFGYDRIQGELSEGSSRKRVGIKLLGKGIARDGYEIRSKSDEIIGSLTSGGFSPSLKSSIGQGYIDRAYANIGEKIFVNVRGRNIEAEVTKTPFVMAKTKSMKKK